MRKNEREMKRQKKVFITNLGEIRKFKANVMQQKLFEDNKDTEEW